LVDQIPKVNAKVKQEYLYLFNIQVCYDKRQVTKSSEIIEEEQIQLSSNKVEQGMSTSTDTESNFPRYAQPTQSLALKKSCKKISVDEYM